MRRQVSRVRLRLSRRVTAATVVALMAATVIGLGIAGTDSAPARQQLADHDGTLSASRTTSTDAAAGRTVGEADSPPVAPTPAARALAGDGRQAFGAGSGPPGSHAGAVAGPAPGHPSLAPSVVIPQDSTPAAAAAGLEPGSMAPLAGVPADWTSSIHRFTLDRLTRSYLMLRPVHRSIVPLPVVVVLHGRGSTPAGIEQITGLPEATGPAVLVYPAGYGRSWDAGGCCGQAQRAQIDDAGFVGQVVQRVLRSQTDASTSRVYLMGFSNGGRLAYRLACSDPGRWAGVGVVEAVPAATCAATTPVPLVVVANAHDPFFDLSGGGPPKVIQGYSEPTVQATVAAWRFLDGCSPLGVGRRVGAVTVESWSSCQGTGRVTYAFYDHGGHYWPQGDAASPSATDLIWSVLHQDRLPSVERSGSY